MAFYKHYVSPIDGERCQMWPSCSDYAQIAVDTYGKKKGLLMTVDRLTRCGNDLHLYPTIYKNRRIRYFDYPEKHVYTIIDHRLHPVHPDSVSSIWD